MRNRYTTNVVAYLTILSHSTLSFQLLPPPAILTTRTTTKETCINLFPKPPFFPDPPNIDKGFNLLETASKIIPQGQIVNTAKESWKFAWSRMMAELAPQDKTTGDYQRPKYSFNGKIGSAEFPDESGRYHVYVGNPCPWCHRVRLASSILELSSADISLTQLVDDPVKASRGGWILNRKTSPDPLYDAYDLRELYDKLSPNFKGRCTAPLLVDKKSKRIVSNESSDIVRMLNSCTFGKVSAEDNTRVDLVPKELTQQIEETNDWVYNLINNGVYKCGFSTKQEAYNVASTNVCKGLQKCETLLQNQTYLNGDKITESDLLLLPTILRYDGVYSPLFRAGGVHTRIRDYPGIQRWLEHCWEAYDLERTIDVEDACLSYYRQLFPLNPGGLLPNPPITLEAMGLRK